MQPVLIGLMKLAGFVVLAPFAIAFAIASAIASGVRSNGERKEKRDDEQFKKDQRELTKLQLNRERRQAIEEKRS